MGYVEMIFKDNSGLLIANDEIKELKFDYCGVCRSLKTDTDGTYELGTFICNLCAGLTNGQSA